MRMTIPLCILALVFFLPALAPATPSQPQITGTVAGGQTVTISGSGFGAKNPAEPVLWAPFSSSIQPSPLGRVKAWSRMGGAGCEVWESGIGWTGGGVRTKPESCSNTSSYSMSLYANLSQLGIQINALNAKFYSFRRRNLTEDKTSDGSNIKNFMLEKFEDYGAGELILTHGIVTSDIWIGQNMSPESYYYTNQGGVGWKTEEIIAQVAGTINQNAARFDFISNGAVVSSLSTGKTIGLNSGNVINTVIPVMHGHYSSSGSQELAYFDDIYFDTTWSRVVIGNAETFSGSTHREMQIPTSWGDSSITVVANTGSFSAGDTVYLYVVDQDGSVSPPSAPIIVGAQVGSRRLSLAGSLIKIAEPGP